MAGRHREPLVTLEDGTYHVQLLGNFAVVPDEGPEPEGAPGEFMPYALPKELERFRTFSVEELGHLPPKDFLNGTPLVARELNMVYGQSDTYKSFVSLGWACQLAAAGLHVVYIAAEGGAGIRARAEAWKRHHDIAALPCLHVMPSNVNLHERKEVEGWAEAIGRIPPTGAEVVLVVVDTLQRNFVGGDENSALDNGLFVDGCERVRVRLGCAVLVIHHTTKDGNKERGGESLRNSCEAVYRTVSPDRKKLAVNLECEKLKDMPRREKQRVSFAKVEFGEEIAGLTESLALDTPIVERPGFLRAVEEVLGEHGPMKKTPLYNRAPNPKPTKTEGLELIDVYAKSELTRVTCRDGLYSLT
jgi:hypothetical protein